MPLTPKETRELKGRAQRLEPLLLVGRQGISAPFLAEMETALNRHKLVKIKFGHFKAEKKKLAPELAEKTGSALVMRVGNVAVYYRD